MALRDQVICVAVVALLAVNVYFAAVEPCVSAEAVVYQRYASHDLLDLWKSPLDVRLGLVYGVVARLATRIGGVSEFTIRVPSLMGGLLFWIALSVICRKFRGWTGVLVFLAITANPWTFRVFSRVSGTALAVGLLTAAFVVSQRNLPRASLLVGLAMGANALVAIPAMVAGAIAASLTKTNAWKWVDEMLLPGLLTGLLLLLPALLIRERPVNADTRDYGTRELIQSLSRQHQGATPVRITSSPGVEAGLIFYRRRFHLDWLKIVAAPQDADYFLGTNSDATLAVKLGMRILENNRGSLIAAR